MKRRRLILPIVLAAAVGTAAAGCGMPKDNGAVVNPSPQSAPNVRQQQIHNIENNPHIPASIKAGIIARISGSPLKGSEKK